MRAFLWGLHLGMGPGGLKDQRETTPSIKFDPKPRSLIPSSVAHKYNGFIFKTIFNPRPNGSVHSDVCQSLGLVTIREFPIGW